MTDSETRQEHAVISAAELEQLRAELAECRRLLRETQFFHEHQSQPGGGYCYSCNVFGRHAPDCPWKKAMGE